MTDVMLDFETLAIDSDACVLQIGACYFDRNTGEIGETFKVNVDAESQVGISSMEPQTIYWWLAQEEKARKSVLADPKLDVKEAFINLNTFLIGAETIWCHTTFDYPILASKLKKLGIKPSFKYRIARDIRTLLDIAKYTIKKEERTGVYHDALDDCLFQVKYCVEAFNSLK